MRPATLALALCCALGSARSQVDLAEQARRLTHADDGPAARRALIGAREAAVPHLLAVIAPAATPGGELDDRARAGLRTLARLAPHATKALPALLDMVDRQRFALSMECLATIGAIGPYHEDRAGFERRLAERTVVNDAWDPPGSRDWTDLVSAATRALSRLRIDPLASEEELIGVLTTDKCPAARAFAAELLGGRPTSVSSRAALEAAIRDAQPDDLTYEFDWGGRAGSLSIGTGAEGPQMVRTAAARALLRSAPGATQAAIVHGQLLRADTSTEQVAAARGLGAVIADHAPTAVKALREALAGADLALQREIVTALGMLGPAAAAAAPALEAFDDHPDRALRARARAALRQVRGQGRSKR